MSIAPQISARLFVFSTPDEAAALCHGIVAVNSSLRCNTGTKLKRPSATFFGMTFAPNRISKSERLGALLDLQNPASGASAWIAKFLEADLKAVRIVTRTASSSGGRLFAIIVSKLGNGWIYPFLAVFVFAAWGLAGYRIVLLAGANAALMHCLYPIIKRRFRRLRPFKVDPNLPSLLDTLDEHSFPSGHAMTLTGILAPIVMLWPATAISAIAMGCCMAWSRVATGHHYPSDVFAGILLGVAVSYPISVCFIAYL
jgi:undecaprenyl-diphosphatase